MSNQMKDMLTLEIKDAVELKKSYMPFFEYGGIFIPTAKVYNIGDVILVRINLIEDIDVSSALATVAWITPSNCHGLTTGVGIAFHKENIEIKKKIELHLLNTSKLDISSYTI